MNENSIKILILLGLVLMGPEAVAKRLPMKKIKTVETVWVPVDMDTEDIAGEAIESVEIPEGEGQAVPLFKEALVQESEQEEVVIAEDEEPEPSRPPKGQYFQVKTPPGQQPVIQVIYQGQKYQAKKIAKPKPRKRIRKPKVFVNVPEGKKAPGDTYNFYFSP